jgi:solute carrier family 8 (sodium/calcium exchanger)
MEISNYPRGRIVKFSNLANICTSKFLLPGTEILPTAVLMIAYTLTLCWLFLGISIVADVFMSSIEKITSQTREVEVTDKEGNKETKRVLIWNGTIANLSLMALGSSAPEILLNCIETLQTMETCPGELGPSTIVGSADFNLLVISGLSIYAVNTDNDTDPRRDTTVPLGVKKINNMSVFAITASVSILAYLWLWIVLMDQNVTLTEAIITFGCFWPLLIVCYAADKLK